MKTPSIILLLSGLLACQKEVASPSQTFDLPYQQPVTIAASGAAQATLVSINDSRCPSDVVCIWGGTIAATVTLADGAATQTVRLGYDRSYTRDSAQVTLHNQTYWLRLLGAQPYPSTKNVGQPKTATFRLHP